MCLKTNPKFKAILLFGLLLFLWQRLTGEPTSSTNNDTRQHLGLKYFTYYNPKIEDLQPQNWCVLQDKQGIIYFANQGGVLEFDGVSRNLIKIPNLSVRSITIDDSGTIYIGGKDEIGYLAPDAKNTLQYVSLLDHLKEKQKDFSTVWKTHATKEGVYFHTLKFLFRWDSGQMKVWPVKANYLFNASFKCGGKLFLRLEGLGLMQMKDDSITLIPGGEQFANKKIYMMAQYQENSPKMLIGTRYNGFFLYNGITSTPFPTGADEYIKKHQLYHGIRLSTGEFALATLRGGLVVIDAFGNLKQIFNKDTGLGDDNVKFVLEDRRGNLWLALNKGMAAIEYASPISIFDSRSNLHGLVLAAIKHHNRLYAGTTSGLYCYSLTSPSLFRYIPGMSSNCWSILSIAGSLLAATSSGVYHVETTDNSEKISRIIENPSYVLLKSLKNPNRIWVGGSGLVSLYLNPKNKQQTPQRAQWTRECQFENISQTIRTMVEDQKGNLWLGTLTKGVLKVELPPCTIDNQVQPGLAGEVTVTCYDTSHGLPPAEINVFTAAGHVMFATKRGIFRFDEKNKKFIPDFTLGKEFADGTREVFRIVEDKNKNIWFHSRSRNFRAIPKAAEPGSQSGSFIIKRKPFRRIPIAQVNTIYPEENGKVAWFGGTDGLIRYDTTRGKKYQPDFPVRIRQVLVKGKLHFGGYRADDSPPLFPVIAYKDRHLRFSYAAPYFEEETGTEYRCFLEGYDRDWSEWTRETRRDYTNLEPGKYFFRVQARNVYRWESSKDVFQFRILPPWTRTWWAFLLYGLAAFFLVFIIVKWRSGKLEQEKQTLEKIIKERTKEIKQKNQQLEEQSEKLKEMDMVKSRFFANISHEFRTPLTLIMGPLEHMISKSRSKENRKQMNLMLHNSQRLLMLINQLLDLSKFDSGKVKLQAAPRDIIPFLKDILASFRALAAQHQLDLVFIAEQENITVYFDPEKMEEVIGNLLSNAFKFTPARGKITVSVKVKVTGPAKEEKVPGGFLEISVSDTGIGIPKDQLPHIFDRFYQVGAVELRRGERKSSGIGLALTKEIIHLHHGSIDVHSREGKGTEFIIRLPLGKEHLKPYEMIEPSGIPAVQHKPGKILEPLLTFPGEEEEKKSTPGYFAESEEEKSKTMEKNVILVVEDNSEVREYIANSLRSGYTVVEAVNGREGIKKAKDIIPDLIISDIMMPVADGYELCRVLKNDINTSHIPIILLTAKASEESVVHGLKVGADDYITKPFNTKILNARIKNLIDLRRHLQMKVQRQKMLMPEEISVSSMDEGFLKEFQDIIEKNISEPELNIDHLCDKLYMSRASLFRKVRALTGQTPNQFILSYRLQRAAQLLKANFGNVTEVALEVGFSNPAYFTKRFREKFHQLPSTFQASEVS